ncbi:MAG TPA: ABC transporter permease [Candidatus Binatia bacterium]|nr:ABC transporter permease [Candidatus Binatia bacterium]
MNTQSNAMSALADSQAAPAILSGMHLWYWSVRRELWEYRFLYLAPLGVAAAYLFAFTVGPLVHNHHLSAADPLQYRNTIALPYDIAGGLMMLIGILMSIFYCSDALHGERRDRSILFWKSLPVSDWITVLAKASIPLIVIPLITFTVAVALEWIMLLLSSATLAAHGLSVARFWSELSFFQMSWLLLYHLFTAHAIWPAPVYAWLILVSAWVRRAVLLVAALPVIVIGAVQLLLFGRSSFAAMVAERIIGHVPGLGMGPDHMFPTNPMFHTAPVQYLLDPAVWAGLLVAAAFLALAVRLRRSHGPL